MAQNKNDMSNKNTSNANPAPKSAVPIAPAELPAKLPKPPKPPKREVRFFQVEAEGQKFFHAHPETHSSVVMALHKDGTFHPAGWCKSEEKAARVKAELDQALLVREYVVIPVQDLGTERPEDMPTKARKVSNKPPKEKKERPASSLKAIKMLENLGIAVPDALREQAEKERALLAHKTPKAPKGGDYTGIINQVNEEGGAANEHSFQSKRQAERAAKALGLPMDAVKEDNGGFTLDLTKKA